MKKLIIAACAVALAGAVQAAEYNWKVTSSAAVFNGWDSPLEEGKAWSSATAQSGLAWQLIYLGESSSQDTILKAIRNGTSYSDYVLASGTTGTDGKIAAQSFTTDSSKFALDGDGKMSAYLAIINDDGNFAYLGTATALAADTEGGVSTYSMATAKTKILMDKGGTAAWSKDGWYNVASVPEPTSGLLLLLGVAGIALRRRRA